MWLSLKLIPDHCIWIVFRFTYSVLAYKLLPDPSWFPNTAGIGMTGVKLWLYHPYPGFLLMYISLLSCLLLFPIAFYRVAVNKKIAPTVAWILISGPSSACYASTLLGQPTLYEVDNLDPTVWKSLHIKLFIPVLSTTFILAVIAMVMSLFAIKDRWPELKSKEFSPAHVAFCFATLNHANCCQGVLSSIDAYLRDYYPRDSSLYKLVYWYW